MIPGLFKSTYEDFIARVKRELYKKDLSGFEVKDNISEIVLTNKKDRTDVRRMFGGTINSEVSIKHKVRRVFVLYLNI